MGFLMRFLLVTILTVAILGVVIIFLAGNRFVLVAKGDVAVDSYPVPGAMPIAILHAGDRVTVLSCDDLKSYPAVHVRLGDGTEGYVIEEDYELIPTSFLDDSNGSPFIISCPNH